MLVVTVAALSISYANLDPETRANIAILRSRGPSKLHPRRIVVAPFDNKTGDSTLDALGEKTADWFARELSEANFEVVDARTARINTKVVEAIPTMLRAHDRNIALGEETGARYVVVGTYYREADSLEAAVSVVDVATHQPIKALGPFYGTRRSDDALIKRSLLPTIAFLAKAVDTTAGGVTASNTSPPSLEVYERISRAWEHFFSAPADTVPVFASLDTASWLDTTYAAPLLMKAYVLDVKSQWADVDRLMKRIRPLAPKMSRIERAALDLFEADLRGDAFTRLAVSKRLKTLSPGSAEMPLLVVVSSLYAGVPAQALATLDETEPDRGMNLIMPAYWEWRTLAQHESGLYADEEQSAKIGLRRFKSDAPSTYSMVRVLATRNDKALRDLVLRPMPVFKNSNGEPRDVAADRQDLLLLAGRELRAHDHAAAADSIFALAARELATLPATADHDAMLRQAHALYEVRDYARARAAFDAIVARDSLDIDSEGRLGTAAAHLGDSATAHRVDRHLAMMRRPFMMGRNTRWRADIAAVEGRTDDAVALLERAVRQGHRLMDTPLNLVVHLDGDFDALRKTPAYATMLQSLAATK
jgi:TolB-like protein